MKIQSNEHPIGLVHRSFATRTTNKRLDKVYLLPANSGPGKKMHGRCKKDKKINHLRGGEWMVI